MKGKYQPMQMQEYLSKSDLNEQEVGLVEWTKNCKHVGYPWVKQETIGEWYDFDISKCDKIFDLLLHEKHIRIPPNDMLP
jgi:hypothetical protein